MDSGLKTPFEQAPASWKPKQIGESFGIDKGFQAKVKGARIVDGSEACSWCKGAAGKAAIVLTVNLENTGGFDLGPRSAFRKMYAFDDTGHVTDGFEAFDHDNSWSSELPPGAARELEPRAVLSESLESFRTGWFVMCALSNSANKEVPPSEKCEIFQVNK